MGQNFREEWQLLINCCRTFSQHHRCGKRGNLLRADCNWLHTWVAILKKLTSFLQKTNGNFLLQTHFVISRGNWLTLQSNVATFSEKIDHHGWKGNLLSDESGKLHGNVSSSRSYRIFSFQRKLSNVSENSQIRFGNHCSSIFQFQKRLAFFYSPEFPKKLL